MLRHPRTRSGTARSRHRGCPARLQYRMASDEAPPTYKRLPNGVMDHGEISSLFETGSATNNTNDSRMAAAVSSLVPRIPRPGSSVRPRSCLPSDAKCIEAGSPEIEVPVGDWPDRGLLLVLREAHQRGQYSACNLGGVLFFRGKIRPERGGISVDDFGGPVLTCGSENEPGLVHRFIGLSDDNAVHAAAGVLYSRVHPAISKNACSARDNGFSHGGSIAFQFSLRASPAVNAASNRSLISAPTTSSVVNAGRERRL